MTRIVILGGGPAGVGAAWRLTRNNKADVTLLERGSRFGGNAASFEWNGHRLDFGSHRLHPATEPEILEDIRSLLGADLLDRPRHGRIRLLGKWVHFPLKPGDLLLHLDKRFALGASMDAARKVLPRRGPTGDDANFSTILEHSLGQTICRHFYFPYAKKIWGREPEELSEIQARRRVSAGSFGKLVKKVLTAVPGLKPKGAGRFFYPVKGFGEITEAYAEAAASTGAKLLLDQNVTAVNRNENGFTVVTRSDDREHEFHADHVFSTIPVTALAGLLSPALPTELIQRTREIEYRAMILIYIELDQERFTEYDAHYFPGEDVKITRLSEPKNYATRSEPAGRTVLCAELPCEVGDDVWEMDETALGELLVADLERSGLPVERPPIACRAMKLAQAYPIYQTGYEAPLAEIDDALSEIDGLLTYGRQGLFAHDNTHHALAMAYAAERCLGEDGSFDDARWRDYREIFATHVVED